MADSFKQDILDDSGWKSRKMWMAYFSIATLGLTYWFSKDYPTLLGVYPTFGGFVLGLVGLYYGSNTAHSFVASKTPDEPKQE